MQKSLNKEDVIKYLKELKKPIGISTIATNFCLDQSINSKEYESLKIILKELDQQKIIKIQEIPKDTQANSMKIKYVSRLVEQDENLHAIKNNENEGKQALEEMPDEELDKLYKTLLLQYNKSKEYRMALENSESKKKRIKKLHEYNEIKDACQLVLGKLAELKNTTISELHDEYELN